MSATSIILLVIVLVAIIVYVAVFITDWIHLLLLIVKTFCHLFF